MLWLMRITARPRSASRRTRSSTCSVCATPSAAVGSSRMTSLEFQSTARAMATVCRCPPERLATFCRTDFTVRTERPARVSAARCSIADLVEEPGRQLLAAEVEVLDDVEVVAQREVLVDDLDAQRVGLLGVGDVHRSGPRRGSRRCRRRGCRRSPLIRVLLPAPLSPTSAVTRPSRTVRSTSCRTCTAPKLLFDAPELEQRCAWSAGWRRPASVVMVVMAPRLPSWCRDGDEQHATARGCATAGARPGRYRTGPLRPG